MSRSQPPSSRRPFPSSPPSNRLRDAPSAASTPTGLRDGTAEHEEEPVTPPHRDSFFAIQQIVQPEDLRVVFQPIVDLATGHLFAFEALVRCRYATPPQLFERAHDKGCVGRLGRMVREVAVPLGAGQPIFLNVHPGELDSPWLVRPDDPIFTHDHDVFLEVTESVPMQHFDLCINVLHELRERGGIHLVVDDLGAGYSNLKSIADLEPRVVKLDRGLVAGIQVSRRQQQLVNGVVRLCHDLNATVVAEGIETQDEYSILLDSGAQLGQGFLFAQPGFPMPKVTWPPPAAL